MTSEHQGRTLRDVYYDEIREFWDVCGRPSRRRIAQVSARLGEYYGERFQGLPVLGRSTVDDILKGNRKGLPSSELVSSIILSLQRAARLSGEFSQDPGPASLPRWHARLRSFRNLGPDTSANVLK